MWSTAFDPGLGATCYSKMASIWKWMYFIYTSRHFTPRGRSELNKLTSLLMCGFIAQLVEHRIASVSQRSRVRIPLKPWFFQAFSFQLLKLKNSLRWSFLTFTYTTAVQMLIISHTLHVTMETTLDIASFSSCCVTFLSPFFVSAFNMGLFISRIILELAFIEFRPEEMPTTTWCE